jgi:hypothetical protein
MRSYNLTETKTALVNPTAYTAVNWRADIWPRLSRAVGAISFRWGASIRPAPSLIHLKQFRRFGRAPATVAIPPIVLQNSD